MTALVLDSEALSQLIHEGPSERRIRAALESAHNSSVPVFVPAAVLAELYRGGRHDQSLDSFLSRKPGIGIIDTDRALARRVGNTLALAGLGSVHHVDATVIAAVLTRGGGVVLTGDPDDLHTIAGHSPGVQIIAIA